MGKITGAKIRKLAKWVYMINMILACVWLLYRWILSLEALSMLYGSDVLKAWFVMMCPDIVKFGVIVFTSYVLCWIVIGFGCIVEDNARKADANIELNRILAKHFDADTDDCEYMPGEE